MRPGAEAQLGTSLDPFLKTWLQAPRPRPCMTFDPATPLVGTSGRAQRSALRGPRCEASSKPPAEGTASALQPPGLSVALAAGLSHAVAPSRAACPAFQEVEDVCLPRMECALLVWWLQRHVLETAGGSPRSRLEGKVRKEAGQSGPALARGTQTRGASVSCKHCDYSQQPRPANPWSNELRTASHG